MAFAKLLIPRKKYLVGYDGKPLPEGASRDELANYLAIERWANSLVSPTAGKAYATRVVAASNSLIKPNADYVCTGTNDDATILQAVNDVRAARGGTVVLSDGTFNINPAGSVLNVTSPFGVTLVGMGNGSSGTGRATVLNIPNGIAAGTILNNFDRVAWLQISNSSGTVANAVTGIGGCPIVEAVNFAGTFTSGIGVLCQTSTKVFASLFQWAGTGALGVSSASATIEVFSNLFTGTVGMSITAGNGGTIEGNIIESLTGMNISGGAANLIAANQFATLGGSGIAFSTANPADYLVDGNEFVNCAAVPGNTIDVIVVTGTRIGIRNNRIFTQTGSTAPRHWINVLAASTAALIEGNDMRSPVAVGTSAIADAGAGTIFGMTGAPANPGWNLT